MRNIGALFLFLFLFSISNLAGQVNGRSAVDILNSVIEAEDMFSAEQNELRRTQWMWDGYNIKERLRNYKNWMEFLNVIDPADLEVNDQITYDFLVLVFQDKIDQVENNAHLMPLNAEGGFLTSMFYSSQHLLLYDEERKDNYFKKLKSTEGYLRIQKQYLKKGLSLGIQVPKLVVKNSSQVLSNQLSVKDSVHFLMKPIFRTKDDMYIQKCLSLFETEIRPAFEKFQDYLTNEYLSSVREEIGISNNANGKEFYEQRVRYFTTLDMSPQEVYDIGLSEVARIKAEMEAVIEEVGFQGSFEEFFQFLREDEQFYAKTGKELLQEAAWLSKKAEEFLPRYFEELPSLPFTVKPVPDDIAPTYTAGRYSGGSYKQQRAGSYWVNTYDLPSRPLYALPALTLHEAVPGHHLQGSLAQELNDLPRIRNNTYLSAFGEGWALYCEYLGKEAGYYKTAYDEFGRLTYEMWRACRLVVDPGMHYMGWTRQQAVDYMASHTALSMHEVNTEIDRYIGWPGQAVSYKIGEIKIRELRMRCEEVLGENFNIRRFHKMLLQNGSVPLSTLENIVNRYIEERQEELND